MKIRDNECSSRLRVLTGDWRTVHACAQARRGSLGKVERGARAEHTTHQRRRLALGESRQQRVDVSMV